MATDLTCGQSGSTGAEVITRINEHDAQIIALTTTEAFNFDAQKDILDIGDTYVTIAQLNIGSLPAGTYMVGMSATYQLDITQKSVFVNFSTYGDTPEEFSKEPKDSTDREGFNYMYPLVHAGGQFELVMQMRKEDTNGTLDCLFSNAWVERKI